MKLQLALDRLDWDQCFQLADETKKYVDIIEIGTGVIKEYGMEIVREMREVFPNHSLLADMKICDAGKHEAKQAFAAGADITTVMAFAPDATVRETIQTANEMGKEMMIDLLGVQKSRLMELRQLGASYVGLHIGKDQQKNKGLTSTTFQLIEGFHFRVAVAGGVTFEQLPTIMQDAPDILIVGSGIVKAEQPIFAAKKFKETIS
ncbi:3-hexulose-6-phosphate synthase [Shouchella patagoniensis]|uniref:3-hexulose-6-phosphate synthase n=1 Tax=Shouchella patagoniensis TaxID=228576 RepID=UPI000995A5FC|nr:3-hexulose-6-phosphate synthase [Shouchella patagoniensis]